MNGYEMMADSYRQLVKQGKIDKETADREIRVYDFLATCDSDDLCRMVDSSAFNDIIRAYESLMNVVKAVGMLKYDREKDQNGNYTYGKYGISNLSKAQDKLIDGLAEYGAKWAREDGFPEMAEEMEKRVGISKGIEKIVEPPAPKRSKGWEMEL